MAHIVNENAVIKRNYSPNKYTIIMASIGLGILAFSKYIVYWGKKNSLVFGLSWPEVHWFLNDIERYGRIFGFFFFLLAASSIFEKVWNRLINIFLNLLLLIGSILFTLICIETILFFKYRDMQVGGIDSPSRYTFYKYYRLNSNGFRDQEYAYSKPYGTFRILTIGDSFTFGAGIKNINDVYPELLEKKLNATASGKRFEVINTSKRGWDTEDELSFLEGRNNYEDADLVIVGYVLNDAETFQLKMKMESEKSGSHLLPYPYGNLLHAYSFTYYILERKISAMMGKGGYSDYIHSIYNGDNLKKHISDLERLIKSVPEKSKIIIVIFPMIMPFQDYPFGYVHELIGEVATANNIPVIDLLPELKKMNYKDLMVSPFDNHPNEVVHQIAFESIYRTVLKTRGSIYLK